jgi:hypothetical protein
MYNQQVITNAAREGARYGIVMTENPGDIGTADIMQLATNYANNRLVFASNTGATASRTCGPGTFGEFLVVTVTSTYTYLVIDNFIPGLGDTLGLASQAVMRCE